METANILTLHLADGFGLYLVAIGAGALIAPDRWRAMRGEFERSPGLTTVTGVMTFAIAAAIVGVHHSFDDPLAIVISLAGIIGAAEGLLLLAVPQLLLAIAGPFYERPRAWAIVAVLLGAALLAAGLTGHATATL
jgi:hypothetical protein